MNRIRTLTPQLASLLPAVRCLFTTREGGSHGALADQGVDFGNNTATPTRVVEANYRALEAEHGWIANRVTARQVHGDRIQKVSSPGVVEGVDGLFTTRHDLALGIQVADCAALLFADRHTRAIAAVHAGWKGAVAGIHLKAVALFEKQGIEPGDLFVFAGPCIGPGRFEVGEEVARLFPEAYVSRNERESAFGELQPTHPSQDPNQHSTQHPTQHPTQPRPHVDLQGFIIDGLVRLGVPRQQIQAERRCTFDHPELFHSFRRDGTASGRMVAFISMR